MSTRIREGRKREGEGKRKRKMSARVREQEWEGERRGRGRGRHSAHQPVSLTTETENIQRTPNEQNITTHTRFENKEALY